LIPASAPISSFSPNKRAPFPYRPGDIRHTLLTPRTIPEQVSAGRKVIRADWCSLSSILLGFLRLKELEGAISAPQLLVKAAVLVLSCERNCGVMEAMLEEPSYQLGVLTPKGDMEGIG
jgi:hypothetical protein